MVACWMLLSNQIFEVEKHKCNGGGNIDLIHKHVVVRLRHHFRMANCERREGRSVLLAGLL